MINRYRSTFFFIVIFSLMTFYHCTLPTPLCPPCRTNEDCQFLHSKSQCLHGRCRLPQNISQEQFTSKEKFISQEAKEEVLLEKSENHLEDAGELSLPEKPHKEKHLIRESCKNCCSQPYRFCYGGDPKHRGIGQCHLGIQRCINGKWTHCAFWQGPNKEICNGRDDDCDGLIDENIKTEKPLLSSSETFICAGVLPLGSPPLYRKKTTDFSQHIVRISYPFAMWRYEITRSLFKKIMKYDPSKPNCLSQTQGNCPVNSVTWSEAALFCNYLSQRYHLPECFQCTKGPPGQPYKGTCRLDPKTYLRCKGYRLPTEAEWEYAYRAYSLTPYYLGGSARTEETQKLILNDIAWYKGNSNDKSHPVGRKRPNSWGLFDMSGNVKEWIADNWIGQKIWAQAEVKDPLLFNIGVVNVVKGGAFNESILEQRAVTRSYSGNAKRKPNLGFRIVRTLFPPK